MGEKIELKACLVSWCTNSRPQVMTRTSSCVVVRCNECGAMTPYFHTEAEAITAWNTPTPQDQVSAPSIGKGGGIVEASQSLRSVPQRALPEALAGPWWADEVGTFNNNGWGFSVIVPDAHWGRGEDELPAEIQEVAAALERAIRDHLNADPTATHAEEG